MSVSQLHTQNLFSNEMLLQVPHNSARLSDVAARFQLWTENDSQPIYSGYRKQILGREGLSQSKHVASKLREQFESMVVMGIGGSALGTRTGIQALQWAVPDDQRRTVHVIDNLDPIEFERVWNLIDPAKTCFAVISKSGTTIETVAQLSVILHRLATKQLPVEKHIVAVTDPEKGALRRWAQSLDVQLLDLPTPVGGRFSVLTPVGLLPLAFAGIDVDAIVDGAHSQIQSVDRNELARVGQRLAELEKAGYLGHVLMPYSSMLKEFGAWFVQLWGESLGKNEGNGNKAAPIPVAAVGDTDQHSLLQLLVEGEPPLITGFMRIEQWPESFQSRPNMAILPPDFASLSFATRKSFWEILNAQQKATAQVLVERNRPVYEIVLKELSPRALGECFAWYMDLVVATAAAHEVNPFNQPGVEHGKKILPEILSV